MSNFEEPIYSRREIQDAGKLLSQSIPAERTPEAIKAFRVAHNWRAAAAFPMHVLRCDLAGKVRRERGRGFTAGRIKRMHSIRNKLHAGKTSLLAMQDIGACRAVVESVSDVRRIAAYYQDGDCGHVHKRTTDYVEHPQESGYRSVHLIYQFAPRQDDERAYSRCKVEIQIRTSLQHVWATAQEAIGAMTDQDLKGGHGSAEWRRLMLLMSAVIADREQSELPPGAPSSTSERAEELRHLSKHLHLMELLRGAKVAERFHPLRKGRYFLVSLDASSRQVRISNAETSDYDQTDSVSGIDAVLVEVDSAQELQHAFPNYFLNVATFARQLAAITGESYNPPETWHEQYQRWRAGR